MMMISNKYYGSFVMNLNDYKGDVIEDKMREKVFGDANYSLICSGRTGSGKDALMMSVLDIDMEENRTAIIFDSKMEYPSCIFMQRDPNIKSILINKGIPPTSYKVNLWIPYTEGMFGNAHLNGLLKYKHPNLKIRPFRVRYKDIESNDTKTFALGLSELQSLDMHGMTTKLTGTSARLKEFREEAASKVMIFDEDDRRESGCGSEYMDFNEMLVNKEVNVFSFYFMLKENTIVAIQTTTGLLNELISRGMDYKPAKEVFTGYIPELQLIMPGGVKRLEQGSQMLKFRLKVGLLLMRSFHTRMRINLQNLSKLDSDMYSQANLYVGKTTNPRDISLLKKYYSFDRRWVNGLLSLSPGRFIDVQRNRTSHKLFTVAPRSHKAQEREHFLDQIKRFNERPEDFLYDTDVVNVTDLCNIVPDGINMTVSQYGDAVRRWIREQPEQVIKPLAGPSKKGELEGLKEMLVKGN